MKKLLVLILIVAASTARCDQLLDAINQHNLERVSLLLQQKEYDAPSYTQYITAAHEVVDRCKNDMKTQDIQPGVIGQILAGICVAASFYPLYSFFKIQSEHGFDDMNYNALIVPAAQSIGAYTLVSFGITMGLLWPFIRLFFAYQDAIDVEKLLLGYQFE